MDHNEAIRSFKNFAYSLIEKYRPEDADTIVPGLQSFKESYLFGMLEKRKQMQFELAKYVEDIFKKVDPAVNKITLDEEFFEIGKDVFVKFTDAYWKSKQS